MPARITVRAELQSLLNKSQSLTDANRLAQLDAEQRRREEVAQLATRRRKAEAAVTRRRQLDDPVVQNRLTAAMGSRSTLAFVLPPGLAFDPAIIGPFAPGFGLTQGPDQWDHLNGALICQTQGYSNNLVTSTTYIFFDSVGRTYPTDAIPTLFTDGSYQADKIVTIPRGGTLPDQVVATLYLSHVIAQGSGIRTAAFTVEGLTSKYRSDGAPLARVPGGASGQGVTIEALVLFAAGTAESGVSRLSLEVFGTTGASLLLDDNLISLNPLFIASYPGGSLATFPGSWTPSGGYQHVAYVVDANEFRAYVGGVLVDSGPSPAPSVGLVRLWDISLTMDDADSTQTGLGVVTSPYPGKSRLNGLRFTGRPLYTGSSFTPPISLTQLA